MSNKSRCVNCIHLSHLDPYDLLQGNHKHKFICSKIDNLFYDEVTFHTYKYFDECEHYDPASDYTKDFLLKNVKSLFGILTEVSDEDITMLRELSAREVDNRAKKRINEYLKNISFCSDISDIPEGTVFSTAKPIVTSELIDYYFGIPINYEVTKKKLL